MSNLLLERQKKNFYHSTTIAVQLWYIQLMSTTVRMYARSKKKRKQLKGSVKEPNISIYLFFHPSLNGVLFPMFWWKGSVRF